MPQKQVFGSQKSRRSGHQQRLVQSQSQTPTLGRLGPRIGVLDRLLVELLLLLLQ